MLRLCLLPLICGLPCLAQDSTQVTFPARFLLHDGTTLEVALKDVEPGAFTVVDGDSLASLATSEVRGIELLHNAEGPRRGLTEEEDAADVLPGTIDRLARDAGLWLRRMEFSNARMQLYGKSRISRMITITGAGPLEAFVLELARRPELTIIDRFDVEAEELRMHWFRGID